MSKISLTPDASGTGTFTLASPNSNTNRTLTLPDAAGELLTTTGSGANLTDVLKPASSLTAANLTGALPAISGAALTGIVTGPTYGTEQVTTSGTSISFTGIPSTATTVVVIFIGTDVSGGQGISLEMGTSGGFVTSGYVGSSSKLAASGTTEINYTDAFTMRSETGAVSGSMWFTRTSATGNTWVEQHTAGGPDLTVTGGGHLALGGSLTQLKLRCDTSRTLAGGSATIRWS